MSKVIYIADDEKNILDLMFQYLSNENFLVETFSSGDSLFEAFSERPCDLIILDIMMPGTDGLLISSKIRKLSNVPIILVSARDSEIDRITGITLGSDDYLTKPFSPMELVARVKSIFRRMEFSREIAPKVQEICTFTNVSINSLSREAFIDNIAIDLTPTEFELVLYMISNANRAISREELLKNVWKVEYEIDTRATDDLIKRLRKKLKNYNSKASIDAVWGFGFKLKAIDSDINEELNCVDIVWLISRKNHIRKVSGLK